MRIYGILTLLLVGAPLLGCSSLLDYDGLSFSAQPKPDASAPDGAAGDSGSAKDGSAVHDAGGAGGATQNDGSVPDVAQDPCEGVTCSDHGTCQVSDGKASCQCETGYHAEALTCVKNPPDPCDKVTCSGKGTCEVKDGKATCTCEAGFHADGLACKADETCTGKDCGHCSTCKVIAGKATCTCSDGFKYDTYNHQCWPDPDPCKTTDCGPDKVCNSVAHCGVDGSCYPTCDCSNCGNCGGDNSDGRWNDWQEYCGAEPDKQPATKVCNKPCPAGSGCLPFSTPYCWPMEGCFSK